MSERACITPLSNHWLGLAYAGGGPVGRGLLRSCPEDFVVNEQLGFVPDGAGQHVWLCIEKRALNTHDVALLLARHAGVKAMQVGYSGLKDKHAQTRQWFSIDLAGQAEPDWLVLNSGQLTILQAARHGRKLRRGTHRSNHFQLRLRDYQGDASMLQARLNQIQQQGVPNYFGEQRFGHAEANLDWARRMFDGERIKSRNQRSLYLSAARAWIFNEVLSRRVAAQTWDQGLPGDVMQLAGTHSIFVAPDSDAQIRQRLRELDIHPTGPLWGRGEPAAHASVRELEQQIAAQSPGFAAGLEQAGLKQERRSLRLVAEQLQGTLTEAGDLELEFSLPAGTYATSVLREIVAY